MSRSYRWETVRSNYFRARRRQPQARAHGSLQSCRACERMPLFLLYSDSRLLVSTSRCVYCVDKCFFRCSVSNAAAADQGFFSLFFLHLRSPLLYSSSSRSIHRPVLASPPRTHGSHATLILNLSRRSVAAAPIENRYITRPINRVFSSVRNYQ